MEQRPIEGETTKVKIRYVLSGGIGVGFYGSDDIIALIEGVKEDDDEVIIKVTEVMEESFRGKRVSKVVTEQVEENIMVRDGVGSPYDLDEENDSYPDEEMDED